MVIHILTEIALLKKNEIVDTLTKCDETHFHPQPTDVLEHIMQQKTMQVLKYGGIIDQS